MATKTIVSYRKDVNQREYEKINIISPLKALTKKSASGRTRAIKLPQYIVFQLQEPSHLILDIQEQPAINKEGKLIKKNTTCDNMQTDNAAFEGWAVCLKAWLPDKVKTVSLKWDIPSNDMKNAHYRRFLYRAWRFSQLYEWFSIDSANISEIDEFAKSFDNLTINASNNDPEKKSNPENANEYDFVKLNSNAEKFKAFYDIDNFDRQLHVGVKQGRLQYFSGRQSAIDLWGCGKHGMTVIELKCKNPMVGIVSELFLYVSIMISLAKGEIAVPVKCNLEHESNLFSRIKSINSFHAEMLTDEYHPLLENKGILTILNKNLSKKEGISLCFGKTLFSYNHDTKELFLPCE